MQYSEQLPAPISQKSRSGRRPLGTAGALIAALFVTEAGGKATTPLNSQKSSPVAMSPNSKEEAPQREVAQPNEEPAASPLSLEGKGEYQAAFARIWKVAPNKIDGNPFEGQDDELEPRVEVPTERCPVITFQNRGMVVSVDEYPKGFSLEFDYRWTHGFAQQGLKDIFAVVLRTNGVRRAWSGEINEGVVCKLVPVSSKMHIVQYREGGDGVELAEPRSVTFNKNEWYRVKITENEDGALEFQVGSEVMTSKLGDQMKGYGHIAMYNRECVHGVPKESQVCNVTLKANK